MPDEIERKYLISENGLSYPTVMFYTLYPSVQALREDVVNNGKLIRQGYLSPEKIQEIRKELGVDVYFNPSEARLRDKAGRFYFTLKGSGGLTRNELETEISEDIFDNYWPQTLGRRLEKARLKVPYEGHFAEFDVFTDRKLILAEVEVPTVEDAEILPPLGKEVTGDMRYKNKNLAR